MSLVQSWRSSPPDLELSSQFIDVWRSTTQLPAMQRVAMQQCLTPLEIERANRYRVMDRREEFIIARGLLRTVLARVLKTDPRNLDFSIGSKGKPSLAQPEEGKAVRFNLSHSHGIVLIAMTRDREVGVDVELIRDKTDHQRMAQRFFSPVECEQIEALDEADRQRAFFHCWTRKEAFLKATGMGITLALDSFDTAFWPAENAKLLATRWDENEAGKWSLMHLVPSPEHVGTVAIEGHGASLRTWQVW